MKHLLVLLASLILVIAFSTMTIAYEPPGITYYIYGIGAGTGASRGL